MRVPEMLRMIQCAQRQYDRQFYRQEPVELPGDADLAAAELRVDPRPTFRSVTRPDNDRARGASAPPQIWSLGFPHRAIGERLHICYRAVQEHASTAAPLTRWVRSFERLSRNRRLRSAGESRKYESGP